MTRAGVHKRKIDEPSASPGREAKKATGSLTISTVLDAASDNDGTTSTRISGEAIPAPIWGSAMNYLTYTDVLKCLLVNRTLSFEAPKYVRRLTILKSCEVQHLPLVRSRRRFENVTRVDIICLVERDPQREEDAPVSIKGNMLCTNVVDKIVPFLEMFPKLQTCRLGGLEQRNLDWFILHYHARSCAGPEGHASHFRKLVEQLAVAFERGSLPQGLQLWGVFEGFDTETCGCELDDHGECPLCSRILRTFPLNSLLQLYHFFGRSCYSDNHIEKCIRERTWSPQCLAASSFRFRSCETSELKGLPLVKKVRKWLEEKKAIDPSLLHILPGFKNDRISLMLDLGIQWGLTEKWKLGARKVLLANLNRKHKGGGYALTKASFDLFIRAGYPFKETDFVLFDSESDLKKLMMDNKDGDNESQEE